MIPHTINARPYQMCKKETGVRDDVLRYCRWCMRPKMGCRRKRQMMTVPKMVCDVL
jgi:hypothetical protein